MFRRIRSIPETALLSFGRINVPLWIYVFLETWFQSEVSISRRSGDAFLPTR
jgi:hypothetical protein